MMRNVALLPLLVALVAACGVPPYRDAVQVEGSWVSNRSYSVAECEPAPPCEAIIAVASEQVMARAYGASIRETRFHDFPSQLADGRTIASTLESWRLVFTLDDGSTRLETFTCDIHGGVVSEAFSPYDPFCPEPWGDEGG